MKNYVRLSCCSLFNYQYAFIDTAERLYVKILAENGIRIKNCMTYFKEGSKLRLIICKIRKCDALRFEELIGTVRNKALLLGYNDYDDLCELLTESSN